jgi:hypothetical protein
MGTEEVCTKIIESSEKNQRMWDCVDLMSEYPHWSGPFFTGLIIGVGISFLVVLIATAR